ELRDTPASVGGRQVHVQRLNADPPWACESIPREVPAAAEHASLEPEDLNGHLYRAVTIDPAAGLDVDDLAGRQGLLKDVSVAMQPDIALFPCAGELVNEDSRPAEQHVADALDAGERVVEVRSRRKELMFPHLDAGAGREMDREDVTRAVARERDLAGALCLGHEDRHARDHSLESAFQRVHPDVEVGLLPKHNVVLEEDRRGAVQPDVQHWNQLAGNRIPYAGCFRSLEASW